MRMLVESWWGLSHVKCGHRGTSGSGDSHSRGKPPASSPQRQGSRWYNGRATGREEGWAEAGLAAAMGSSEASCDFHSWLVGQNKLLSVQPFMPPGSLQCSQAETQWFWGKCWELTDTSQQAQKARSRVACQPQVGGFGSPCQKLLRSKRSWPHAPGAVGQCSGSRGWFFSSRSSLKSGAPWGLDLFSYWGELCGRGSPVACPSGAC